MVPEEEKRTNPTFAEFVDNLLLTKPFLMDKHWAPFFQVKNMNDYFFFF